MTMDSNHNIVSEPEWLGRNDTGNGTWVVTECNPRRGEPYTNLIDREMKVPMHDTALARAIRAHEMMHAKVSPVDSFPMWVARGVASEKALIAVEELRVNFLCSKTGFDVKANLADGGETADGERVACTNDWIGAVHMSIATAGTASNKLFLNGIRRHNRMWGDALADISKRAVKEMKKAHNTRTLASTDVEQSSGLFPYGFSHTERLAEWVDRLASIPPQELNDDKGEANGGSDGADDKGGKDDETGDSPAKRAVHTNRGRGRPRKGEGKRLTGITPSEHTYRIPTWSEIEIERLPMPLHTKGNIGKKRIASNVGRSPRRLHRYMTDPEKRVFDKVSRGSGGVVVIDASGSMNFNHEQIRSIVENAPGATVLSYSEMQAGPSAYVLADKGRMCSELPKQGAGNGVDFPALEWAVKNRQRSSSPIIWVTDGGVCGKNDGFSNILAMQCINFCKKHNIIVLPYVEEAIGELRKMRAGQRGRSRWPMMLRQAWRESMGTEMPEQG